MATPQEGWTCTKLRTANHYFRDGVSLCKQQHIDKDPDGTYFIMEMLHSALRCRRCMKVRGSELGKTMDLRPIAYHLLNGLPS